MKNSKRELINDIITGLMVAATFAAVVPGEAFAQLSTSVQNSANEVFNPAIKLVDYVAYAMGTVMVVAGIAGAKKHTENAQSNPLAPALGKLGAGAAFLVAPTVIGMLSQTGQNTATGTATFQTIPGVN